MEMKAELATNDPIEQDQFPFFCIRIQTRSGILYIFCYNLDDTTSSTRRGAEEGGWICMERFGRRWGTCTQVCVIVGSASWCLAAGWMVGRNLAHVRIPYWQYIQTFI